MGYSPIASPELVRAILAPFRARLVKFPARRNYSNCVRGELRRLKFLSIDRYRNSVGSLMGLQQKSRANKGIIQD